jgi:hypothetical protein
VAATDQGYLLIRQLHPERPSLFERNDGTELQRLDRVYNASKHADEYIANGNRFAPGRTLTVWLLNEGLECNAGTLSFRELADSVELLARAAEQLSSTAPASGAPSDAPAS